MGFSNNRSKRISSGKSIKDDSNNNQFGLGFAVLTFKLLILLRMKVAKEIKNCS